MRTEITFQNLDETNQNPLMTPNNEKMSLKPPKDVKITILLILISILIILLILSLLIPKKEIALPDQSKPIISPTPSTIDYAMPTIYVEPFKTIDTENDTDPNPVPPQLQDNIGL